MTRKVASQSLIVFAMKLAQLVGTMLSQLILMNASPVRKVKALNSSQCMMMELEVAESQDQSCAMRMKVMKLPSKVANATTPAEQVAVGIMMSQHGTVNASTVQKVLSSSNTGQMDLAIALNHRSATEKTWRPQLKTALAMKLAKNVEAVRTQLVLTTACPAESRMITILT